MEWTVSGCNVKLAERSRFFVSLAALLLSACASDPAPPYPAFVDTLVLPDVFVAGLPGVRAKQLVGDQETRRSSNVLALPPGWEFTTGGFPDMSVEIYVIAGNLRIGDLELTPGGYAWLPAGMSGLPLLTEGGARVLYFLDDALPGSVIQTPLIVSRDLLNWQSSDALEEFGLAEKVLREDPGTGARTWLLRVEPGADIPWQRTSVSEEGFLLEGSYRHTECVAGETLAGDYLPGGYFQRPADAVNGGPESMAVTPSVWYLRRLRGGETVTVDTCH